MLKGDTSVFEENGLRRELTVTPLLQADNHHVNQKSAAQGLRDCLLAIFFTATKLKQKSYFLFFNFPVNYLLFLFMQYMLRLGK